MDVYLDTVENWQKPSVITNQFWDEQAQRS